MFLKITIFILIYILYKWFIDGSCGLTVMEYYLLGHESEQHGFIYRLVNPMVSISETTFSKYLTIFTIGWLLMLIIIYIKRYHPKIAQMPFTLNSLF